MTDDLPWGWVKPVATPTRESLKARITELRTELAQAEAQLQALEDDARLEALVRIRILMRAYSISVDELRLVSAHRRHGRPRKAGRRRAPAAASQGRRGVMPMQAAALPRGRPGQRSDATSGGLLAGFDERGAA